MSRALPALLAAAALVATARGQDDAEERSIHTTARVLVVRKVDRERQQLLFDEAVYVTRVVRKNGEEVMVTAVEKHPTAFALKKGKAITPDGQPIREADLWARLAPGK